MYQKKYEPLGMDISLLNFNHAIYENDFAYSVHSHEFYEMFYIVSGAGSMFIEGDGMIPLKAGDIIIINPLSGHLEFSDKNHALEYMAVGFTGFNYELANNKNHTNKFLKFDDVFYKENGQVVLDTLTEIKLELKADKRYSSHICNNHLTNVLLFLLRNDSTPSIVESQHRKYSKNISYIIQFIEANMYRNLTLDEILSVSYYSKYYLIHTFKKEVGVSIFSYILKRKCDEAIILLSSTDRSIRQISEMLGFSSIQYFYRKFKEQTKNTPLYYRNTGKKTE